MTRHKNRRRRERAPDHDEQIPTREAASVDRTLNPRQWSLLFLALLAIVALVYYPAWHGGILWDDEGHLTKPELRSTAGLWRIWFELGATQQYYPVVHSAFWLMNRIWGEVTLGYHLVNIALHATSAFLAARILARVQIRGAILAAVLFAVHPVHAESVAWMTELKNTLSGVFYLAAALTYLRFDQTRNGGAYTVAFLLFVLALLSKTVTATLPAALLVLVWGLRGTVAWRRDLMPLVPFFVVGAAAGFLTMWVERTFIGAIGSEFTLSPLERCLVAGRAIWFYLWKLAWPADLIFFYPRWDIDVWAWWQYLYPLGVLVLLVLSWMRRASTRAPLAALLFFVITLGPALGFVNVFPFKYSFVADHFQYLASLGILALVAAALTGVVERRGPNPKAHAALVVTLGLPLAFATWQQSRQYVDAPTLYRTTIARNPDAWLAHNNLAMLSLQRVPPNLDEALKGFDTALAIAPNEALVRFNVGTTLYQMGRVEDALAHHRAAVQLAPRYAEAWGNLGTDLQALGHNDEAVEAYRTALGLKPTMHVIRANLGIALLNLGRPSEATSELRESLASGAGTGRERVALAVSLVLQDRLAEAIPEYEEALRLAPDAASGAELHNELGTVLARVGRRQEAIAHFREALRLTPDFTAARDNLDRLLAAKGS